MTATIDIMTTANIKRLNARNLARVDNILKPITHIARYSPTRFMLMILTCFNMFTRQTTTQLY